MKRLSLISFSFLLIFTACFAQDDKSKRPSPPMMEKAKVGDVDITIDYSSPKVKGRKIYGDLVPFDKVWRAGANEATTFEISKDVKVEGKTLKKGKYALFVTPSESGQWTVIFNSVPNQWGTYNRDAKKDVLKVKASASDIKSVENLKYSIESGGKIHLDWSTKRLTFTVQ